MATTLITGGAGDIGRALAMRFAQRGHDVIVADLDGEAAVHAAASVGERARAVQLDVCDAAAVDDAIAELWSASNGIDVVINNAGIGVGGRVEDLTVEQWRAAFDVNVLGTVNVMHSVYPRMVAARAGHIVNVASLAGLVPTPLLTPYCASKYAVVGLSLSWRIEAAPHGVTIQAMCPGPVDTKMLDVRDPPFAPGGSRSVDVRAYLTAAAGKPIAPDALADAVLRAMKRGKSLAVMPSRSAGTARMQRVWPWLTGKIIARQAKKFTPRA